MIGFFFFFFSFWVYVEGYVWKSFEYKKPYNRDR